MPELPEVENLRRGLEKTITGQKIIEVKVNKPKLVSGKGTVRIASKKRQGEFILGLRGERFIKIERRAKNLIFRLSHNKTILAHLKMSGQFVYRPGQLRSRVFSSEKAVDTRVERKKTRPELQLIIGGHPIELSERELPNKHTHVIFELERGTLFYNDTRMFGYLLYYSTIELFEGGNHFEALGLEPLEKNFTINYFAESLQKKKGKIKAVLMSQDIVTGIGNIYADEILFEAKIDPSRIASSLKPNEVAKLHGKIIDIMRRAIKAGGSSVATYRMLDESRGNYAREHKVYGKGGKMCLRCAKPLEKTIIQSRTTIFCPRCQK